MTTGTCDICKKSFPEGKLIAGHGIHHEIENLIVAEHPDWNDRSRLCQDDFNAYRAKYVATIIDTESGHVQELQKAVLESIRQNEIITANVDSQAQQHSSLGERISDHIAQFGGSWTFIITFFVILFAWIALNAGLLLSKPFDPYPFILMNLILSCVAAIQAPIIMMSQNRQETKDRMRSENDYQVNLKSEIEIRTLHEKVDHLLLDQWSRMMNIQEMQIEILEEIKKKVGA